MIRRGVTLDSGVIAYVIAGEVPVAAPSFRKLRASVSHFRLREQPGRVTSVESLLHEIGEAQPKPPSS